MSIRHNHQNSLCECTNQEHNNKKKHAPEYFLRGHCDLFPAPVSCLWQTYCVLHVLWSLFHVTKCYRFQVPPCAAFLTFQAKINKVTSVLPGYFRLGGPPNLVHGKIGDAWLKNQRFNPTEAYDDI